MGPSKATALFYAKHPEAHHFNITLYGSLAATGKGHLTNIAILDQIKDKPVHLNWEPKVFLPFHPNGMKFEAVDEKDQVTDSWQVYSIGGGALAEEGQSAEKNPVYPFSTMDEILDYCNKEGLAFWQVVEQFEGNSINEFLTKVWHTMCNAVERGIENEGTLPGVLKLQRKAPNYYVKAKGYSDTLQRRGMVYAYALAVAEENAAGGLIVTAPTCGACAVVPAVLYQLRQYHNFSEARILRALATAGLIGTLVKTNASISGAEVGCQGEIGTACSMAAAAVTQLLGGTNAQIEYAAEMGMEHHLGLTCDPVAGLVQIPCIERNAMAADRAFNCSTYSLFSDGRHRITFDQICDTMLRTGRDLAASYKETATGGLATL
jgi:L-serine dehydratase, iron-sulfur-dependent, single chain form